MKSSSVINFPGLGATLNFNGTAEAQVFQSGRGTNWASTKFALVLLFVLIVTELTAAHYITPFFLIDQNIADKHFAKTNLVAREGANVLDLYATASAVLLVDIFLKLGSYIAKTMYLEVQSLAPSSKLLAFLVLAV